jgi:DNA end-binding protein Ku
MARAVWSGTISFGLVSVPVRLYPATRRKDVRFHEIDRLSGQRVRHQRVVESASREWIGPVDAQPAALAPRVEAPNRPSLERDRQAEPLPGPQPVAQQDLLKGFEVAPNRYVTVAREELDALAPERSRTIDVEQFVDVSAVDPIYYDVSYYAVPERDHERAFGLLVEAMRATKRMAISWFVLRRKRYLAALRPHGRLLVLTTLFHADEILPAGEIEPGPPRDLTAKEREMAALLVNTLAGPFEPERYPDQYRQRLTALIEGRAASAKPAAPEVLTGTGVQDLMAALKASVEQARQAGKGRKAPTARRKRKSA